MHCVGGEDWSPLCPHTKMSKKKVNSLEILGVLGMISGKQGQRLCCGAVPIRSAAAEEQGLVFAWILHMTSRSWLRQAGICCQAVQGRPAGHA